MELMFDTVIMQSKSLTRTNMWLISGRCSVGYHGESRYTHQTHQRSL